MFGVETSPGILIIIIGIIMQFLIKLFLFSRPAVLFSAWLFLTCF